MKLFFLSQMHIKVSQLTVGYVILKRLYFTNVIFLWLPKLNKKKRHFEQVSSLPVLDGTKMVFQTVTQMEVEMINFYLIQKR